MTKEELEFFDRISRTWDEDEIRSTPERVNSILNKVGLDRGQKILDLGTGTGVLIPYLSAAVGETGTVKGIDLSTGMLEKAISKYGRLGNVTFERSDIEAEELDGEYDLIFLYCVYPHLHNPEKTLRLLADKNLRKDGRIIIAFPSDETLINNIHKEKKAESDILPPAYLLCRQIKDWGFVADVLASTEDEYIVEVRNLSDCGKEAP